jgi:DNA-binding winged helix-turn-helix (wHTH) protein/tetratricopeptide (TPR) repeat protein
LRFDIFSVDLDSGELRKQGHRIKLQEQPFQILAVFLERPGEVVAREELRKRLWPSNTFVDFDHGLNIAVAKLREALGDSSEKPRFIETLPRRGYRFIARVEEEKPEQVPPSSAPISGMWPKLGLLVFGSVAAITLLIGAIWWTGWLRERSLTDRDSILLADFANGTDDSAFDGTLKQALAVELGQSPFLNILPDERVRQTLQYMNRPPEERVIGQVAREICERQGIKAMLTGSISALGTHYVIALEALNSRTGDSLARDQFEVTSKEEVLRGIHNSASRLREKLGESLSLIEKFEAPLEQTTTSSLDALKAFTLGEEQRARGLDLKSIPFFKHSIELDPKFALAYARLGQIYANVGESDLGLQHARRAFELRDHTSGREKLFIASHYYESVSGEIDRAIETYELWARLYPRDWLAYCNLAFAYDGVGDYEKAGEAAREALRFSPGSSFPYEILAQTSVHLNRFNEAKAVCERAVADQHDSPYLHAVLYSVAFVQRDGPAMLRESRWAMGQPANQGPMLNVQALGAASLGQLRSARELFDQAGEDARRRGLREYAASIIAREALTEAEFGNYSVAREQATKALATARGKSIDGPASLALARSGDIQRAQALTDELARRFPLDTEVSRVSLPVTRAAVEIRRGNPSSAIEVLRAAAPYDLGSSAGASYHQIASTTAFTVCYLRGEAHLQARSGNEAAAEFQKILKHRGVGPVSPHYALAHLGLARAYAVTGDIAKSRRAYQDFLRLWRDADPATPILQEARAEYANLN